MQYPYLSATKQQQQQQQQEQRQARCSWILDYQSDGGSLGVVVLSRVIRLHPALCWTMDVQSDGGSLTQFRAIDDPIVICSVWSFWAKRFTFNLKYLVMDVQSGGGSLIQFRAIYDPINSGSLDVIIISQDINVQSEACWLIDVKSDGGSLMQFRAIDDLLVVLSVWSSWV